MQAPGARAWRALVERGFARPSDDRVLAPNPDDLERSVARPSVQERRKAKLKPGKPTSTGPRAKTYALPRRGRGCDSWKAKTRPTTAMDASRPLAAVSRSIGFRDHSRGLRCAASAREPPSSPKRNFNPLRTAAPLPRSIRNPTLPRPARARFEFQREARKG